MEAMEKGDSLALEKERGGAGRQERKHVQRK